MQGSHAEVHLTRSKLALMWQFILANLTMVRTRLIQIKRRSKSAAVIMSIPQKNEALIGNLYKLKVITFADTPPSPFNRIAFISGIPHFKIVTH